MLQVSVASTVACSRVRTRPSLSLFLSHLPPPGELCPWVCVCLPILSRAAVSCVPHPRDSASRQVVWIPPYIPIHKDTAFSPFSLTADPGANKLRAGHPERSKRTASIGNDGEGGRAEEEEH
ncbi:hypothetical protein ASPTUDRAFT_879078 [Aspergillus tubingensis CBS 134.48]|uniref:Uncharacterized protein n=1 Tax=Aspergillus tubingensis (strain CBS 134.48) TaxID=767770 RepID=A0A1L9MQZ4_ASPTC|nr:hypothetical protein ASPTUDRAFT_879078 [Aspergillus tubingensis CBS 134.48]